MNEDDSFDFLFKQIIGYTTCLLYSSETKEEILSSEFVRNNDQANFSDLLFKWGEQESETALDNLKKKGVNKKYFELLVEKVKNLQKIIVISPTEEESMSVILNVIFVGFYDEIRSIYEEFEDMYENFPLKDEELIIIGNNGFQLINPFFILDKLMIKMHEIFDLIDANNDIPFDSLDFSSKFSFLPSMINEVELENIDERDFKKIKKNCCHIIIEGFVFNQVCVKLNEEQLQDIQKKLIHSKFQSDDQFQLFSEYENLNKYWKQLYEIQYKCNNNELKSIYHKYSKDKDILKYLKPLINEVIPFFEIMKNESNEIIKLTFEISEKYQLILKELSNGKQKLYDKEFIVLFTYHSLIKFELIDIPDLSYNIIFSEIIKIMNIAFIDNSVMSIKIPDNISDAKNDKTLIQQKYSLIYNMLNCLRDCGKDSFCNDDIFLIFSLFTWHLNVNSQEAKNLEDYLVKSIKLHLDFYDFETNDLKFYAKYIVDQVNQSKNPLNQDELNKNITKFSSKSLKTEKSTCSACCNIQ